MTRTLVLLVAAGLVAGGVLAGAMAQQPGRQAGALARAAAGGTETAGGSSAYAVGGIAVDVSAKSVNEARRIAWTQAQRKAWPQLWSRLTGRPESAAPRLSDGQIDQIVAGIESQGEMFSANRYIARLGVVFDRSRTMQQLGGSLALLQSPPMLLLPLLVDGGAGTLLQARNGWRDAWVRYRGNVTPIDYVIATGSPADNLWLTPWQARRSDRGGWRTIMARFDTVDVLVAEAQLSRRFPGGPVSVLFIARHGPDGTELGRFALTARSEAGLPQLLDDGVARIDALYAGALRTGQLRAEADLAIDIAPLVNEAPIIGEAPPEGAALIIAAVTPDADSLAAAERLLASVGEDLVVQQMAVGGTSRFAISVSGGEPALQAALSARGWRLERLGEELVLRRGAPPATPAEPAPAGAQTGADRP